MANASTLDNVKVQMAGVENNGVDVYVLTARVPAHCAWGGFYFKSGNAAVQNSFLDVALNAKQLNRPVRIDYVTQATTSPAPNNLMCVGVSIYIK